MRQEADKACV